MKKIRIDRGSLAAPRDLFRQPGAPLRLAAVAALVVIALIAGYLTSHHGPVYIAALLLGGFSVYATFRWPRMGFIMLLFLTSTITSPETFSAFMDPKYIYYAYSLMLLIVTGSSLLYAARTPGLGRDVFEKYFSSPVAVALAIFGILVLIKSMTLVIEQFSLHIVNQVYIFDRGLSVFMLFIPALLLSNTRKRQRWMVYAFFVLGAIVATRVMLELFFPGWSVFRHIEVSESLSNEVAAVDVSVQRLRAPGGTFMLGCFWIGFMNIALRRWNWRRMAFYVPFTLVMLVGEILEFNRSFIIPMGGLFLISMFLNKHRVRTRLIALTVAGLAVLVLLTSVSTVVDKYVQASVVRYGSSFTAQAFQSQSVESRGIEDQYAFQAIEGSPLFGIALDDLYRPPVYGMLDNLRWYIHDAYVWLWTYFGTIGLLSFLAVLGIYILRCALNWKRIVDPLLQTVVVGFAFSIITLMAADIASPKFYDFAAVPVAAMMIGVTEAIILSNRTRGKARPPDA